MKDKWSFKYSGFTLIELLIVVLIIAILAAIAVPNFLEFQTRAKVSRVVSDMRSMAIGVEAYIVDNNQFPASACDAPFGNGFAPANYRFTIYAQLTTPISYLTSVFQDPFAINEQETLAENYEYRRGFETGFGTAIVFNELRTATSTECGGTNPDPSKENSYIIWSVGPDQESDLNEIPSFGNPYSQWALYDPTNGSVSVGDVARMNVGTNNAQIFNR